MIPTAGFKPICLVLHDEQQSQIIKMLTVNAKLLDYGYEQDKRKPQNGSCKTWQNLAVYLEVFMEQFLLCRLAGDFKLVTWVPNA